MKTTNSKATATNKEVKETKKVTLPKTPAKGKIGTVKGKPDAAIAKGKAKANAKIQNVEHQLQPLGTSGTLSDKLTKGEAKVKEVVKAEAAKPAKVTRQVGDIHPNGLWVWKEIKDGKFDWRTIPSNKPKAETPQKDKVAKTVTKKADKAATKPAEPAKLTVFLKNRIKTEVTEKLKDVKDFKHALWAKQTDNRLYVEFNKASKVKSEKLASIQAELAEEYKDLTVVFEVRKSLN